MTDDRMLEVEARDLTPCVHCGCAFNVHKGGKPSDEPSVRRKCPRVMRRGEPMAFPRTYVLEDRTRDYSDYNGRVAAYWGGAHVFTSECGDCRHCSTCRDRGL